MAAARNFPELFIIGSVGNNRFEPCQCANGRFRFRAEVYLGMAGSHQKTGMKSSRLFWAQIGCLFLIIFLAISGLFTLYKDLFLGGDYTLNHPVPSNINVSSLQETARYASQYAERWQDGLFLERYSATYQVLNNDRQVERQVLHGEVVFRFTGWRSDLLKDMAEQLKVAHLLASVTVDVEQRQVVRFSHSQGTPFGYRAPLNLDRWPISEDDLFKICDAQGGQTFRLIHNVDLGHVGASVRKPGREWSLVYNASPQSFRCLVNIDTGRISVRDSTNEWQEVGTWMEELQTLEDSHKEP